MNEKTLKLLEFDLIREHVANSAFSDEARERILREKPFTDDSKVNYVKQLVAAIVSRITSGDVEPQGRLPAIGALLPVLNMEGASLSIEEAFAIGSFVREGGALLRWLGDLEASAGAPDCSAVEREVFRVLDKDGELRDLPVLKRIKERIAAINKELRAISASYTNNDSIRRMLQSSLPSQRDGRLVIALKHQFIGKLRGIIHDVSASGQTVFLEPEDIVEKNNLLTVEQRHFEAEVRRILRELTMKIASEKGTLALFHERIIFIETMRARARYSSGAGRVFLPPDSGQNRVIMLRQARHPLLGLKAVPIDMLMTERVLVISGPNTGGKTVSLKTAGLFVLMNQFGLALPLAEGSLLPVFENVFADIGDDQSLEHSLSTFSAHISAVAFILKNAGENSLVLLDELCAGTDPAEGGAIAMAILDSILEKNCFCIATTHHGALKNYAFSNSRVENASVEFDPATQSPSYRIVMGLPGESRALEISLRYGLSAALVDKARSYLGEGRNDVSALIAGLKEKYRAVENSLRELALEKQGLLEDRREADLRELRLRRKEAELREGYVDKLRSLLDESRKTLENLVREIKEGGIGREKTLKVKDFLLELDKAADRESEDLKTMKTELAGQEEAVTGGGVRPDTAIQPGLAVLAGAKKLRGRVRRPAKKGFWVVEIGSVSTIFSEKDIVAENPPQDASKPLPASIDYSLPSGPVSSELNVRGMRLADAIDALQRHIDSALVLGLREFAVIHGKGDGILRSGIHDYLKSQGFVTDYHFSSPELGGFGRTEVTLGVCHTLVNSE
ncbi:MAG: Smr/MutS family protein [Spirochaetaceae bacterium]|jgi:DNA mismatch repair protein MutS2|nr:Smr/MutS family protein [Spirochaetaceae bacterium]